jgi:hypothetical protein
MYTVTYDPSAPMTMPTANRRSVAIPAKRSSPTNRGLSRVSVSEEARQSGPDESS